MIETQVETVSPSAEQDCISTMADFGWTLQSSRGDYPVKLTFQRDTAMPNYERVCELERGYFAIQTTRPDPLEEFNFALWCGLFFFVFPLAFLMTFVRIREKKKYNEALATWYDRMEVEAIPMREEAASLVG